MTVLDTAPSTRIPFLDLAAVTSAHRDRLEEAWRSVVDDGRFVGGPAVERFETEFSSFCGVGHAVGVANGTDALELILAGLSIGDGDEVVVPTNTFVATVEAICAVGAVPRFVDVRPDTLLADPDAVADAVGPRTAAIVAVHLFGHMSDPEPLRRIARARGLALIEDAAQAHGARYGSVSAGGVGVAAAFSFYPGKNLGALGDAGAVVSDDADLAARIRRLADHGRSGTDRHVHEESGRNSRLDALQAAVLSAKLPALPGENAGRTRAVEVYRRHLPAGIDLVEAADEAVPAHHLAVVRVAGRRAVTEHLDGAGIGWGIHYPVPCHRQPAFARFAGDPLPVAEAAARQILSLPLSPHLSDDLVERVCSTLAEAPR